MKKQSNPPQPASAKQRPCRTPDYSPWPPVGFVTPTMLMAAFGCSDETLKNYEDAGLIEKRIPIGLNQNGWPVDQAREMVAALPEKIRERTQARWADKASLMRDLRQRQTRVRAGRTVEVAA